MQDDITDGVKWAVSDGVADAKRICIYGASYGGYAALTGVFRRAGHVPLRCRHGWRLRSGASMYQRGDIPTVKRGVNYLHAVLGDDMEDLEASPTRLQRRQDQSAGAAPPRQGR